MEYIDKTQGAEEAHAVIDAFLSRCNEGGFGPNDDLYAKMDSDRDPDNPRAETTKRILRRQLLRESGCRCCYCMRNIDEQDTTLEHLIPNKIGSQQSYDDYISYFPTNILERMMYVGAFLENPRWPNRAYPHSVAYENLAPSCNGKFARDANSPLHGKDERVSKCCNNKRGDEFIIPFVLDKGMVSQFRYLENGLVVWPVDSNVRGEERVQLLQEHKNAIDRLQLNCPELVAIRRIWFFLATNRKGCNIGEKDRTIIYLTEDPRLSSDEKEVLNNFWNDNYWQLLEEYTYFNDKGKFFTED